MTDNQVVKIEFNVSHRILGCAVDFHDGSSQRVDERGATQLLSSCLSRTRTPKQSLVRRSAIAMAFDKGLFVDKPPIQFTFAPGVFTFASGNASKDIKRIVFDVEFTIRPKKSS
jgi:hypothetical protein